MKIVQITPGAGKMICGACLRDNSLVKALRKLGHSAVLTPLYLPASLDGEDQSSGTPIFFGGINVYLEQKSSLFRNAPAWLHRLLASPKLLHWAASSAAKTDVEGLGEMTISMLKGEEGNQARELEELLGWLKSERPDVVCLSNALLIGLARRIKSALDVPVLCSLQGEDYFLDALPAPYSNAAWQLVAERAADIELFIAPSQYYASLMRRRLGLASEHIRVVYNGIDLEGFAQPGGELEPAQTAPTIGFFARMCREKGLDKLVEAFVLLKKRNRVQNLKLRIGGYCGPRDRIFVDDLRTNLKENQLSDDVEFCPNLSKIEKQAFYRSLTVLSTPAVYGEAFGLYIIESLASGVPVVQPSEAAFPELIAATGGGVLCEAGNTAALANAIEGLLLNPGQARQLGQTGRKAVFEQFGEDQMAQQIAQVYTQALSHYKNRKTDSGIEPAGDDTCSALAERH